MSKIALYVVSLVAISAWPTNEPEAMHQENENAGPLAIIIHPLKTVYKVGESIQVRAELQNRGPDTFFVGRDIPLTEWITWLELSVTDEHGHASDRVYFFHPQMPDYDPQQSIEDALARFWITLPPGYFYGTVNTVASTTYEFLQRPGRYRLQGIYHSEGMEANLNYNRLAGAYEAVRKLPFKDWRGNLKTNSVWITVVPASKR